MSQAFQHLIDIESLSDDQLQSLVEQASLIKARPELHDGALRGRILVNLFFEASTRTRFSFEIAARRLGMHVVNFSAASSSVSKGETLLDSFRTVQAMGPDVIVFRHPDVGSAGRLAIEAGDGTHVINAGDGSRAHPSQALLDMVTLAEHFDDLSRISVLIAGDLRNSRVTHSDVAAMRKLGVGEIRLASPPQLRPDEEMARGARVFDDFEEALADVDVVMTLRVQKERLRDSDIPEPLSYHRNWGLNPDRLALARPGCLVMHPGPMNRGVEISSEVADGPQSVILEQVTNGVYARMAILLAMLGK
ncbi:MAG: aspartate carbamoyltransferase catalytic subunit [Gammaproteobacteria bacterium]|nr:aspartate carbamoyltransferase catalytic subunit [Gammaproteobacteria bacterium]